jgi:polyisoprenoid-binding protein YceI
LQEKKATIADVSRFAFRALLWALLVTISPAQESHSINLTLDPEATKVQWTLGDVLHTVHGTFRMKRGVIHYDPVTGEANGLIEIDATSGESGTPARDQKMHQNILNSAQYQAITFRPTHVEGKFEQTTGCSFNVDGIFNLHGRDHPMKMKVTAQPQPTGVRFQTHFEVPYVDWGLKDPSTFVLRVNKDVSIDIDALGQVSLGSDPGTRP